MSKLADSPSRLLIISPTVPGRHRLALGLRASGFLVEEVGSVDQALSQLVSQAFELLLVDKLAMEDGSDRILGMTDVSKLSNMMIIMITDHAKEAIFWLERGANDCFDRSVTLAVVVARIKVQLDRRRLERELWVSEERYALATRGANDGLWDWDLRNDKVYYSHRWRDMLGYRAEDIGTDSSAWFERIHPNDRIRLNLKLDRYRNTRSDTFYLEHRLLTCQGTWLWVASRGLIVYDADGQATRMVGWLMDTSNRIDHDSLTNLPGRGLFVDRLGWALAKDARGRTNLSALLYLGLNRFRLINEGFGHDLGDQILIMVAERILGLVRPQDTLARLGGDEFGLLVENVENTGSVIAIAERIIAAFHEPLKVKGVRVYLTGRLGIVLGTDAVESAEWLRRAQCTMEATKEKSSSGFCFYEKGMGCFQRRALRQTSALRHAFENGELSLVYQPQFAAGSALMSGVEAKLRWPAEDGNIPTGTLADIAEGAGLSLKIGEWMLRLACLAGKTWQNSGFSPLRIAVKLHCCHFRNFNQLYNVVEAALEDSSLEAGYLDLEVSESVLAAEGLGVKKILDRLHGLGVYLSLSEFGNGFSSLAYLKELPFDCIKLDRCFIEEVPKCEESTVICKGIIRLVHSLRKTVKSEGVKTESQAKFLAAEGCDFLQGSFLSKPLASEAFALYYEAFASNNQSGGVQ